MNFDTPAHVQALVRLVRDFREEYLVPQEGEFLLEGHMPLETRLDLQARARDEYGLWALEVPQSDGGLGLGLLSEVYAEEELSRCPQLFHFGGTPEPILQLGNERQKAEYYYPVIEGNRRAAYAFTEPDAGSDLRGMSTRAVRTEDGWSISGRKTFISNVERADHIFVYAKTTADSGGPAGISCFIVDKGTPGMEVTRSIPTMGDEWAPSELGFRDCCVPEGNLLGEQGRVFAGADRQLAHGRIRIAAEMLGVSARSIEVATSWARQRRAFGSGMLDKQAIQFMVADNYLDLETSRFFVRRAASLWDSGADVRRAAFAAKLVAADNAQKITDRCIQMMGGLGYAKEVPVQSFYRHVRVSRIGHGAAEVLRWMVARSFISDHAELSI